MKRAALIHDLALGSAGLGTALGFLDGRLPWLAVLSPIVVLTALVAQRKKWILAAGGAWFLLLGLCAAGLLLGGRTLIPLTASASALVAWDLAAFEKRIGTVLAIDANQRFHSLERAHLRRLLPVVILGWLLGLAVSLVRIQFGFYTILVLAAIAALGLNQLLHFLRREST